MATQTEIANHLDMSERNARDVLKSLGIDWTQSTLDQIRIVYLRDLREKAAGRGGDNQGDLARAKADESVVKTAKMRLEYNRDIKTAIHTEDAAAILNDWARFANREYTQGVHKLVSEIQAAHEIEVAASLINGIASATTERVKSHAAKLGHDLIESIEPILDAESGTDG